MDKEYARITRGLAEFLLLSLLALIPSLVTYIDLAIVGNRIGEVSVTEITQEAFLLATALTFAYGARRFPDRRGFFVLMAGFFGCALLRELDNFLDVVWHGFWVWPVSALALGAVGYVAIRCRDSVVGPMARFIGTRSYYFMLFGLVVLLVFSRTFGSGRLLWKSLMGEAYVSAFNTVVQEGIELLGYICIVYGSVALWFRRFDG
ncbi:MAG: hypothetical protein M9963_11685 [Kiritimatiellae bacterium]|nr:hypothetical protein [Kiritimatiellia bacterium]